MKLNKSSTALFSLLTTGVDLYKIIFKPKLYKYGTFFTCYVQLPILSKKTILQPKISSPGA